MLFFTTTYLINILPSSSLSNNSPFLFLHFKLSYYKFLKAFGCSCFPHLRPYNSNKLTMHSKECIFLGYSSNHKGYKCLDPNGRVFISKYVLFNENKFPFPVLFPNSKYDPLSVFDYVSLGAPLSAPTHFPSSSVYVLYHASYSQFPTNSNNTPLTIHISSQEPTSSHHEYHMSYILLSSHTNPNLITTTSPNSSSSSLQNNKTFSIASTSAYQSPNSSTSPPPRPERSHSIDLSLASTSTSSISYTPRPNIHPEKYSSHGNQGQRWHNSA